MKAFHHYGGPPTRTNPDVSSDEYSSSSTMILVLDDSNNNNNKDVSSEVSSLHDNSVVIARQRSLEEQQKRGRSRKDQDDEDERMAKTPPPATPTLHLDMLHGRQQEIGSLQEAYDRVACTGRSEAILLKGKSGSGKTRLVDVSLRNHVVRNSTGTTTGGGCGGLYASGKYDQMLKNGDPYSSALASVLEDVCVLIRSVEHQPDDDTPSSSALSPSQPKYKTTSQRIRSSLEPQDLQLLQQWIPSLRYVVDQQQQQEANSNNNTIAKDSATGDDVMKTTSKVSTIAEQTIETVASAQELDMTADFTSSSHQQGHRDTSGPTATATTIASLPRFKTLLQILVRCMASSEHPLVIFLDDLQWADPTSLQVLQALLTDSQSHHVLYICTIREEEMDSCGIKSSFLKEWMAANTAVAESKNMSRPSSSSQSSSNSENEVPNAFIPTTLMRIGNLQVPTLTQLLTHALDLHHHKRSSSSSSSTNNKSTSMRSPTSTLKLAQVLHKKTGGRPYCVVAFLQLLVSESLLVYSNGNDHHCKKDNEDDENDGRDDMLDGVGCWTWDLHRIQAMTDVSDSVVPVLMRRVERMPDDTSKALQVASCLGHDFDGILFKEYAMKEILQRQNEEESNDDKRTQGCPGTTSAATAAAVERRFQAAVTVALRSGLIEAAGGMHQYKFTHDSIQQCFYNLMDPIERARRHWMLGQILKVQWEDQQTRMEKVPQQHSESARFFLMVDQLNRGTKAISSLQHRKDLIGLNMEAGQRARSISAFAVAATVLRAAHQLMADTEDIAKWGDDDEDYNMTLSVCIALAEYEGLSGNFAESYAMTNEIVSNARSFQDKLPAYSIQLDGLSAQGRFRDGFDLGLPLLEQLGESFPSTPRVRHVLYGMIRVSSKLLRWSSTSSSSSSSKRSIHDFLTTLPRMTDPIQLESMKLMKRLCSFAMFLDEANYAALLSMRMLRRTLSWGHVCIPSAYAIAIWSITQATLGNTHAAYRYGCIALDVLKRVADSEDEDTVACPATIAMVYGGAMHWKMTCTDLAPIFHRAYIVGFHTGDIDYAFMASYNSIMAQFYTNTSLLVMERTMRETVTRMKEFGQDSAWLTVVPFLQMMQNLLSESDDGESPLVLSGDAMVQEEVLQQTEESNNIGSWIAFHMSRWTLAIFFSDWELAQICASNIADKAMVTRAHFSCLDYTTYMAMTALVSAERKTAATDRRRRSRAGVVPRRAKRAMKTLRRWHQDGKEDALTPLLFLEAECANVKTAETSVDDVAVLEEKYRKAAENATSRISTRARALERCGQVLWKRGASKSRVKELLLEARDLYEEWGAVAKVIHIEETIKNLSRGQEEGDKRRLVRT